jgi:subtilase family serine protease
VASAGQLERAFSVSLERVRLHGRRSAVVVSAAPALGAAAAGVQSVVGLNSVSAPRPLLVRSALRRDGRQAMRLPLARPRVATGGAQPCPAAQGAAFSQGAYTADQIASAYGFSGLYGAGDRGGGATVAVYELEPVLHSDIAAYQSCYGTHAWVTYTRVDGGPAGGGAGSGEAALDVENLIGLVPRAKVIVYQGQNSSSGAPGAGPYDTFRAIIDQDLAQVVSVSWGECEAALGSLDAEAENLLFEQAAVQGQTIVSAAGDSGSEDCDGGSPTPQTQLSVDDPSSQPFVTGVGGTTLQALGPRPTEGVWNTAAGQVDPLLQPGAGGGGISLLWQMPPGQRDAAAFLHVLGAGPTGAQCGRPGGYCRESPDVSADADPTTGYIIYYNGSGASPGQPQGWQAIGGTSAAAPVWAAVMALADSSRACAGGPIGYAVPALYRAAGATYAADFNDVRSGNNDFTGTNDGLFPAGPGYDEATGLGTPNATPLIADLCAETLRLASLGNQRSAVGASVSLRLRVQDARGATVSFHATGLPPGLSLNPVSGRISGRARHRGTYHVTVTALDGQAAMRSRRFVWMVGAMARIVNVALSGVSAGRPRLTFTIVAGHGAPGVSKLEITAPRGLRLVSTGGLSVSVSGAGQAPMTAGLADGTLTLELKRAYRMVRVALSYPGLMDSTGRHPNLRGPRAPRLAVAVFDAGHGASRLRVRI